MWEVNEPKPVKLIIGILAADENSLNLAVDTLLNEYGDADSKSTVWPFTQTEYY